MYWRGSGIFADTPLHGQGAATWGARKSPDASRLVGSNLPSCLVRRLREHSASGSGAAGRMNRLGQPNGSFVSPTLLFVGFVSLARQRVPASIFGRRGGGRKGTPVGPAPKKIEYDYLRSETNNESKKSWATS
jgi:hypothetical protein